jgi:hypothetical protein
VDTVFQSKINPIFFSPDEDTSLTHQQQNTSTSTNGGKRNSTADTNGRNGKRHSNDLLPSFLLHFPDDSLLANADRSLNELQRAQEGKDGQDSKAMKPPASRLLQVRPRLCNPLG